MPLSNESPEAMGGPPAATGRAPALAVTNPSGNRSRVPIDPVPFLIGRQGENNLVLRDNRISRNHARISVDDGAYVVEDLDSRHGVFVNGQRVKRHKLKYDDRIDFGFPDSYRLAFTLKEDDLNRVTPLADDELQDLATAALNKDLAAEIVAAAQAERARIEKQREKRQKKLDAEQ